MNKCILCKSNVADKSGSHIVPHFLLKRIENIDGKKGRDYELGYEIQEFDTKSHFGRAVSVDKLEETYGPLSDEEIENNKHPLVVDNIFCTECEKRLSVIEAAYATTLKKKHTQIYSSGLPVEISLLFWMSVLWRMSINKKSGVQLKSGENEFLRRVLNRYLKLEIKEINVSEIQKASDLKKVSYKILRAPDYSEKDFTLLLFDPRYKSPYSLLIDEFLLFFSFKSNYTHSKSKEFYSFNAKIEDLPENKINSGEEQIYPLEDKYFANINQSIINKLRDQRAMHIERFLNRLHKSLGYPRLENNWKQKIYVEITSEEKKLGRKYTLEDLKKSVVKVLRR